jgi:hypothetical protein
LGTDVFVFKDDREEVVRLQVKACTVPHIYADGSGYSAKFALPMKQFHRLDDQSPMAFSWYTKSRSSLLRPCRASGGRTHWVLSGPLRARRALSEREWPVRGWMKTR